MGKICTTHRNIKTQHLVHTPYECVPYRPPNKQPPFLLCSIHWLVSLLEASCVLWAAWTA